MINNAPAVYFATLTETIMYLKKIWKWKEKTKIRKLNNLEPLEQRSFIEQL